MSEVRLIDANALKKAIQNDLDIGDNVGDDGYYNAMNMCLEYIDNAPTVEQEKVIVPVCQVNFDKEQLKEIVDKWMEIKNETETY